MCFLINFDHTKEFKDSLDDGDVIYAWKWLTKLPRESYVSILFHAHEWIKGKRAYIPRPFRGKCKDSYDGYIAHQGFYFYTTKRDALESLISTWFGVALCKFEVRKEDILYCSENAVEFTAKSALFVEEEPRDA